MWELSGFNGRKEWLFKESLPVFTGDSGESFVSTPTYCMDYLGEVVRPDGQKPRKIHYILVKVVELKNVVSGGNWVFSHFFVRPVIFKRAEEFEWELVDNDHMRTLLKVVVCRENRHLVS